MPKRLLIGAMSPMLRGIVTDLVAGQTGLEVVDVPAAGDLVEAAREHEPDVVVTTADEIDSPGLWKRLHASHPGLRLVTVAADGSSASLRGLGGHRVTLHDVSLQELLAAILASLNDAQP